MSDILLSVGMQKGNVGSSQLEIDIKDVVARISKNPPKVSVGLKVDQSALKHFRTQLSQIVNSVSLSQGAPITVNISGLGEISAQAASAASALNDMKAAARAAQDATNASAAATAQSTSEAKKAAADMAKAESERQRLLRNATSLLTQMQDAERNWTKAAQGKTKEQYANIQSYISQVQTLRGQFEAGAIDTATFKSRLDALNTGFVTARSRIKAAGEATKTLSGHFGSLVEKFGSWLTVSQVVMAAIRTIKKMVTNVVKLDTAMTELKKVTNESNATYERFLDNATVRAKKLGASLHDVVSASADFARLGYGVNEAAKLADIALMYKNIGDGVEDVAQASESIVSTMQAFGILPDKAEHIVDVFNSIGNAFAISSGGVGEALQRSAAAMNAAGNTLEETAALVAAANTVVQNPDSVGTTLKTVSMFLRASKVEAEEAGESTEGMADSVSKLRDQLMTLTDGRVDILTDSGQYKSTYEILKDIASVWDDIVKNGGTDSAAILELIGGKRNANVVAAILENFDTAEKALSVAMNSTGSAVAENEKHLKSITGMVNQFKASWEALSQTVVSSSLVKALVGFGNALISTVDSIAKFMRGIGTILSMIPLTIAAYQKFAKVKTILDGVNTAWNSFAGGAKRRSCEYARYTVVATLNESLSGKAVYRK
jgi:TP901 family phage tail tape measure protein